MDKEKKMTKIEQMGHEYCSENELSGPKYDCAYDDFMAGACCMRNIIIDFMLNFKNGDGEFPLYDYVGNVMKIAEE